MSKYSKWLITNRRLPAQEDLAIVYHLLISKGWSVFSDVAESSRNKIDPWTLFPGAQSFKAEDERLVEPLICFKEGVSIAIFDESGFGFYDFDSILAPGGLDENQLEGKVVFYPYENVNAYR